MDTQALQIQFGIIQYVIARNTADISHEESLIPPPAGGNSLNWLLGHIVKSRNEALVLMGRDPLFPPEKFANYAGPGGENVSFEDLLQSFEQLQEPLVSGLGALDQDALNKPAPFSPTGNPNETIGSLLTAFAFHEAYHAGQTGVLRRLLGKGGALPSPDEAAAAAG